MFQSFYKQRFLLWLSFVLIVAGQLSASHAKAQPTPTVSVTTPFANKRVAIYISKKNLSYTPELQLFLGSFLLGEDSLDLNDEKLKLAFSIRLGDYWSRAFNGQLGADSAFFVNADPQLGSAFVKAIQGNDFNINLVRQPLQNAGVDYVLILNELKLSTELRKSVYTISNQLITEHRKVKLAKISCALYQINSNQLISSADITYDPDVHKSLPQYLKIQGDSQVERYLVQLSNLCLRELFNNKP